MAAELLRYVRPPISRSLGDSWADDTRAVEPSQPNDNILLEFIRASRPWSRVPVPLPRRLRGALIALLSVALLWSIWLVAMAIERISCHGPVCTTATLHGHVWLLLACGSACVICLIVTGVVTRAFTRCGGRGVIGIVVGTVAGWVSLLGIAALLSGLAIVLIVLLAVAFGFIATS